MEQSDPRTAYLAHATDARRAAAKSFDVKTRQGYIAIAQQWEMMAQRIDQRRQIDNALRRNAGEPSATAWPIPASKSSQDHP